MDGWGSHPSGAGGIVTDGRERSAEVDEEEVIVRLLRGADPRFSVSTDRAARVRSAVRTEWQTRRRRRTLQQRGILAAAFTSAGVLFLFTGRAALPDRGLAPPGEPIAVVEAVAGAAGVQQADAVRAGQWVETGPGARVALRLGGDASLRLDRDSRMRALSPTLIELSSGAMYVDTGDSHGSVEIRTPFGTVRDIGTQFEVRLVASSLRVRVRTGAVELRDGSRSISAQPGTEITFSGRDVASRPIAPDGPEWKWIADVAPPIDMEGLTLSVFLDRLAREQGWTVEYRGGTIARQSETDILHGSVRGLTPHEAVEVAVAASGLRHRFAGGSLIVSRGDEPQGTERGDPP
jgi:hypothetical protein